MSDETAFNRQLVLDMPAARRLNRVGLMAEFWWEGMVREGPPGIGAMRGLRAFEYDLRAAFLHSLPNMFDRGDRGILIAGGEWVAAEGFFADGQEPST